MDPVQDIKSFDEPIQQLIETVAYNCNIADAHNAQENTMCIYLLKMRDFYRWSHNLPLNTNISKAKLGKWINDKEQSWEDLYDKEFQLLNINNQEYDPFDIDNINLALKDQGLHYSAGFGRGGQVHFHLGAEIPFLTDRTQKIYVTSTEYARDLTAAPAHSINGTIFLRKEALQHYIWEKYEEWTWKKPENAMYRAMQSYSFETDLMRAINQMCGNEIYTTLLHEEGELAAGKLLTEEWEKLLITVSNSRAEILVRASRDHLADCLITLPALIKEENWPSIHFYFANFEGFRKIIWPELIDEYKSAIAQNSLLPLEEYIKDTALPAWKIHTSNVLNIASQKSDKPHKLIAEYFEKACNL